MRAMNGFLPRQDIRRLRLRALKKEVGSFRDMARKLRPESKHYEAHLTNIANGERTMGDRLARDIEIVFEKPPGWMDHMGNSERLSQIMTLAERLSEEEQEKLIGELKLRTILTAPHGPEHDRFMADLAKLAEKYRSTPKTPPRRPLKRS